MIQIIQKYNLYLRRLGLLTGMVYLVGALFFSFFPDEYFYTPFIFLPILFFVITFGMHIALMKSAGKEMGKFATRFLLVFGLKILFFLILITTYVLIFPEQAVPFLVAFLVQYLLYALFETIYVARLLKSPSNNS